MKLLVMVAVMATASLSREAYSDTGLDVLSDLGYGGFKLAAVCNRLGRHQRVGQAHVFADRSVYLLIGYEQSTLHKDESSLEWIADQLLECLDSSRFATIAQHT